MEYLKIILKQIQPIHIGYKKHGVIAETRLFIPNFTIRGAFANQYGQKNNGDFKQANESIFNNISCFFPTFDKKGKEDNILFPEYKNGELYLKSENNEQYSEKKFRNEFTETLISTAISPQSLSAKDESLHEIDIILPKSKTDTKKQLYWVGVIKISENEKDKIEEITEIFVGGEQKYGFGLMKINNDYSNIEEETYKKWNPHDNNLPENMILRHFNEYKSDTKFEGTIEPIIEFNYSKENIRNGEGKYYITPGSKIFSVDRG